MLRTLASCWNKERLDVFEAIIEEVKRLVVARNQTQDTWLVQDTYRFCSLELESRTPGLCSQCSATELQWPDNHQHSQTSMFISGWPLTEFWWHILSGCRVWDWGIQYHLWRACIEDCEGWLLSRCCGSVAEHWLHKLRVMGLIPGCFSLSLFSPQRTSNLFYSNKRQEF